MINDLYEDWQGDVELVIEQDGKVMSRQAKSCQVEALGRDNDVLVAISTSGNSENVIRAVEAARKKEMKTIGWLGRGGGKLYKMVDCPICVPHTDSGRVQEGHIMIGHITCRLVEEEYFK